MRKSLALALTISSLTNLSFADATKDYAHENNYCAAIRGNGELMPAHWGSMARLTERYGMPAGMAGGSSASITMFLMESISLNKIAQTDNEKALLIKSIEGYMETLSQTDDGKAIIGLLADKQKLTKIVQSLVATQGKPTGETAQEILMFKMKHMHEIQQLMTSLDLKEIINPEILQYIQVTIGMSKQLKDSPNETLQGQVDYRYSQIQQAIQNFGKFNTITDNTLFFRPGVISFEKVAMLFGRMANFYAGYELGDDNTVKSNVDSQMAVFLKACGTNSNGKSWQEIAVQKLTPTSEYTCRQIFGKAVLDYRAEFKNLQSQGIKFKLRVNDKIGDHLATFPTTSVIVKNPKNAKDAVTSYLKTHTEYLATTDKDFGKDYKVHPTQYQFGYWGNENGLNEIKNNLGNDKKSKKFRSLGDASWLAALSTSPAEPGLARILPIMGKTDVLSAGGWDDLHPTLVLKAVGCKNVIYVTRRGGDSMFGQGVIEKLTHIGGFDWKEWEGLTSDQKRLKNAMGNKNDIGINASSWSKIYNLSNPESSFSKSLKAADAVWCTNWDMMDVKNGMHTVVADGYNAPIYNRLNNLFFSEGKNGSLTGIDSNPNTLLESDQKEGSYEFSGCLSN